MPFLVASPRALILAAAAVLAGPIVVPGAGVAANAIAPMMSGDIPTGERLSLASPGLWTIDGAVAPPDEVQVQFQRLVVGGAWADIAGETGAETASYLTTEAADHGTRLRVGVRMRKGSEWSAWAYSRGQRCTKAPLGSWFFSGGSTAAQQIQSFFAAPLGDVAISIAAPAVFTRAAHGRKVGDKVTFHTAGGNKLPDGVKLGGLYFVTAVPTPDTFQVATTSGGAPIETTGTQIGTHIVSIPTTRLRWVKDGMPDTGWYDQFTYGDSIATKWLDAGLGLEPGNDRTFVVNVPTVCSNPAQAAIPAFQGNAAAPAPTAAQTPITRYDTGSASWVVGSVIVGDHNMSIGYALRNTYQRWAQRTAEAILALDDAADTITVGSDFYATATDGDRVFFTPGSGGALPGGVAIDSVYYLRKAGSDKIEIYGTPNGAKTANPASKRNITSASTLPVAITRARFEKADGTPLAVNDTSTPNPYVHAAIKGWTRKLVASSIWGRSDGFKVLKYRGDHEHNGTWYIFQVQPGIEQEWSFNYRFTLETVWSEAAAKILADYPQPLPPSAAPRHRNSPSSLPRP